ncbi:uncharacterized protein LOC119688431 [Teleopsis dalmanni]|uniref:uncharacterized protein LOC119688431 n=1 Tax=Teleopsis dalmanni TaxID=139649 RepID=UPI0018CE6DA6|nr:uncharacterized protein LOC119688431 [Teleopsis dalmanni]
MSQQSCSILDDIDSCKEIPVVSSLHPAFQNYVATFNLLGSTLNLIDHLLIVMVTIAMSLVCFKLKLEKTAFHAFVCTFGFVLLLAEGMMVRYNGNILLRSLHPDTKTTLHYVLQLTGGLLGILGTLQKVYGKKKHFKSLHGKLGLAACLFCTVNFLAGTLALYSTDYRSYISPLVNKIIHNGLGLITFLIVMLAQLTGYNTGFFRRNFVNIKLYKFVTFVILVLSAIGPVRIFFKNYRKLYA